MNKMSLFVIYEDWFNCFFYQISNNFHFKIKYFDHDFELMEFCFDTIRTKGLLFIMNEV